MPPRLLPPAGPFLPAILAACLASCVDNQPYARAYAADNLSQTIGGPKALARPGDIILENDRIRVAVLGTRPSLGPHTSGGSLVDADLQRNDDRYQHGHGLDQLAEVFPTVNMNVAKVHDGAGTVSIVNDGSDGGPADVCIEGPYDPFITLLKGLWPRVNGPSFRLRTDYILAPGSPALLMRTVATIGATQGDCDGPPDDGIPVAPGSDDAMDIIPLAMQSGMVFGDFYLQGGSVDVFTPEIGFDEEVYIDDLRKQGVNTFEQPIGVDYIAGTADGVSYGIMSDQGKLWIPMFTSSQTVAVGGGIEGVIDESTGQVMRGRYPDGTQYRYDRWFTVGRGDVGSVVDNLLEAKGTPTGHVEGHVVEAGTGVTLSGVAVFAYKAGASEPWLEWTTDVGDDPVLDGSFAGNLPSGDWELQTYGEGRPVGERVPVTITAGQTRDVALESPQPASVHFTVHDGDGIEVPAKVTFIRVDGTDVRHTDLGDSFIGGKPAEVVFAPYGQGQVGLPPGQYQAIASRGIEYEIDESQPFTITAHSAVDLDLTVVHTVDTTGWISADFHVHAQPSFDAGVSLPGRVATMAAEGVDFFASSDHDAITDYRPIIDDMGLEPWVSSAVGTEVTTIELGHFLGFPLYHDYLADNGGALDWTGLEPQEIMDGIRAMGDPADPDPPLVFVGHPRDGIIGYFDQFGLDPYASDNGQPIAAPSLAVQLTNPMISSSDFSLDFDAVEVLNAKRLELIRTPLTSEEEAYQADPSSETVYDMLKRTMAEQDALIAGSQAGSGSSGKTATLGGGGNQGTIDDWFNLLNLGYRITALGNSDTHGTTEVESGCPRNFVASDSDDPAMLRAQDIAAAVKAGKVVATYGPFIRFSVEGVADSGPGSTITGTDPVTFDLEVDSPSWFDVERVEVYENGTLIQEYDVPSPNEDTVNFTKQLTVQPDKDSWYVVIAMGSGSMAPVFTPVDIAPVQLQDVVVDALSGVPGASTLMQPAWPIPRTFPIHPYGLTNPIWIDRDADGFDPPGLAPWLVDPGL